MYNNYNYEITDRNDKVHEAYKRVNEASQVKSFIDKFQMKMKGSTLQTAAGWVDGIGELKDAEKKKVLSGILKMVDKKSATKETIKQINKDNPWTKGII